MSKLSLTLCVMVLTCFSFCFAANKDMNMAENKNPVVLMKTNKGDIKIELFADKAPVSSKNFLDYVANGHYNGTIFHRVIDGFMIQGGGFTKDMKQKGTLPAIANEADNGLKNERGTLAMARTSDINSATAQFFINVKDNEFLNFRSKKPQEYGYAVFGKVIEGMDVVDSIKKVKTGNKGMHGDVPVDAIEILDVSVVK